MCPLSTVHEFFDAKQQSKKQLIRTSGSNSAEVAHRRLEDCDRPDQKHWPWRGLSMGFTVQALYIMCAYVLVPLPLSCWHSCYSCCSRTLPVMYPKKSVLLMMEVKVLNRFFGSCSLWTFVLVFALLNFPNVWFHPHQPWVPPRLWTLASLADVMPEYHVIFQLKTLQGHLQRTGIKHTEHK